MKDFAPVAQNFSNTWPRSRPRKMTFADWKLTWTALNPDVTIDDAYDLVMKSVAPLAKNTLVKLSLPKSNVGSTFAANEGK